MPYEADAEIDAIVLAIAQAFGARTDRVAQYVDQFGADLCRQALNMVQAEMRNGFSPQSPLGYMVSLLRKGVIQAEAARTKAVSDPEIERLRLRYERAQANPKQDTALKRLNRVALKPELEALARRYETKERTCNHGDD